MKEWQKINELLKTFELEPTGDLYDTILFEIQSSAAKFLLSRISSWDRDRIVHYGVDAFRDQETFYHWLWQTLPHENAKPVDLIRNGETKKLLGIIGRIKTGIY